MSDESIHSLLAVVLLSPWMAIAGLAAVFIPVFIHLLFRRKRRPIEWAAMRFVREAWAARRRRLRLEQWILLATRCLIPIVLGLALAQPILDGSTWFGTSRQSLTIILDDGITSSVKDNSGQTEFDLLKDEVSTLIRSLSPGDQVVLIRTSEPNSPTGPTTNLAGVEELVRSLSPSYTPSNIPDSVQKAEELINSDDKSELNHQVVVLSNFRAGTMDFKNPIKSTFNENVQLSFSTPADSDVPNIKIKSIEPLRKFIIKNKKQNAGQPGSFGRSTILTVTREGNLLPTKTQEINIQVGKEVTSKPIFWEEGQEILELDVNLSIPEDSSGVIPINIQVDSRDGLVADDTRYMTLKVDDEIQILILDRPERGWATTSGEQELGGGEWIEFSIAPNNESGMQIDHIDPVALVESDTVGVDVIILTRPDLLTQETMGMIGDHVDGGGLFILTPPSGRDVHRWTKSMQEGLQVPWTWEQEVRSIDASSGIQAKNIQNSILSLIGGELPGLLESVRVHKVLPINPSRDTEVILELEDGTPLLLKQDSTVPGGGSVIHITTPMDPTWTDLPTKPLMVPLFQELIRSGLSNIRSRDQLVVGEYFKNPNIDTPTDLVHQTGLRIPIDVSTGTSSIPISTPGHWTILRRGREPTGLVEVNINPESTDTTITNQDDIAGFLGSNESWLPTSSIGVIEKMDEVEDGSLLLLLLIILLSLVVGETILSANCTHGRQSRLKTAPTFLGSRGR